MMTEKEKRAKQMLYDANYDQELMAERAAVMKKCHEYNLLPPDDTEKRNGLIRELLGKTEGDFTVISPFWCDYGYNIEIGRNFFSNYNLVILDGAPVKFGDNVFIGPDCGFYTAEHPIDFETRNKGLEYAYPITVGDNVWIGGGVRVLAGVTIGNDVVIGAGSVVTKDIPDHSVAVGNPCKIIKKL